MSEWKKFKVGKPPKIGFANECKRFSTVSHTSHVESAISIIERGEIKPYLVFDKSILNDKRILVSWLSPNYWSTGFRYGNISFDFDFKKLIEGKKFYWVESISYMIPAPRILVTNINHDHELEAYDPTINDGPWWHDTASDEHYYNGNYCLEFMFESEISLTHLNSINFVDHHKEYCSIHRNNPKSCHQIGFRSAMGGAVFIARIFAAGQKIGPHAKHFLFEEQDPKNSFKFAHSELKQKILKNTQFGGSIDSNSEVATALARSICSAFSYGYRSEASHLASLFKSQNDFETALAKGIGDTFSIPNWEKLVDV